MRSIYVAPLVLIALLFGFSQFAQSIGGSERSGLAPVSDGVNSIGVLIPLSGPLAEFGESVRNGIELARKEHPENFRNLNFVYEDSRYDAKTSIGLLHKLRRMDEVSLIFNWGTATGQALASVAESMRIPLISNTQTASTSEGKEYVVRFINPSRDFSAALLSSLRAKGHKRFGIVKTELGYINDLLEGMGEELRDDEVLEIIDSYNPADRDFRSTITKLTAQEYDAVGVFLISGQIRQFYRQLSEQKIKIATFGTDFFESQSEITEAGADINGAIYANIMVSEQFSKKYQRNFASDTHLTYASNAYDFAMLSSEIFSSLVGGTSGKDILNAYLNMKAQKGTSGDFGVVRSKKDDKYFSFPVGIKEIVDGRIREEANL